jgi:hypothetical protein
MKNAVGFIPEEYFDKRTLKILEKAATSKGYNVTITSRYPDAALLVAHQMAMPLVHFKSCSDPSIDAPHETYNSLEIVAL